jgi:hypothetical protein
MIALPPVCINRLPPAKNIADFRKRLNRKSRTEYKRLLAGIEGAADCWLLTRTSDTENWGIYLRDSTWHLLLTRIRQQPEWKRCEAWTVYEWNALRGVHLHVVIKNAPGLTWEWLEHVVNLSTDIPSATPIELDAFRLPAELLRSVGNIVGHPAIQLRAEGMRLFKEFCDLAFSKIEVEGSRVVSVQPMGQYRELFAVALANENACWSAVERIPTHTANSSAVEISDGVSAVKNLNRLLHTLEAAS